MESLDKPVGERLLQAMAQAYPDAVDLRLLSMVLGCDITELQASTAELVEVGLAHARDTVIQNGKRHYEAPCISDKGMAVADGLAANAQEAAALLDRLEAATLRALLAQRIHASRLSAQQAHELHESLAEVSDRSLVDAARVWAHQTVGDWRALVRVMRAGTGPAADGAGVTG